VAQVAAFPNQTVSYHDGAATERGGGASRDLAGRGFGLEVREARVWQDRASTLFRGLEAHRGAALTRHSRLT